MKSKSPKFPKESKMVIYVGTHKLSAFIGTVGDGDARILAHREKYQPEGFDNGLVVNLDAAVNSIESLVGALAPNAAGRPVKAYVVLGNAKLSAYSFSSAQYYAAQRTVSTHEIRSVIDQTRSVATLPLSQFVLQVIPESFLVNDMENISNPLGLEALRLGVNLKIFTMEFQDFKNLSKAFEAADLKIMGYWPRMLTVSEAVLTEKEKEEGVILIDVADQISQLVLWKNRRFVQTCSVELGGKNLTQSIAREWQIDFHDAQRVKERFATLESGTEFGEELIPLVSRNGKGNHQVKRQEFQSKFRGFAEAWLEEILSETDELAKAGEIQHPHLVFSGGGTALGGFLEFFTHKFQREGRVGFSRSVEAPQDVLVDPSLAAVQGMYLWLAGQGRNYETLTFSGNVVERTLASAKEWFYEYF